MWCIVPRFHWAGWSSPPDTHKPTPFYQNTAPPQCASPDVYTISQSRTVKHLKHEFMNVCRLTCPRFSPKYRATGSPHWILGNCVSLSLLITVKKSGFDDVAQRKLPLNPVYYTVDSEWVEQNYVFWGNLFEQHHFCIITHSCCYGYYLASSSFTSSRVITMCSGTNWRTKKNKEEIKDFLYVLMHARYSPLLF